MEGAPLKRSDLEGRAALDGRAAFDERAGDGAGVTLPSTAPVTAEEQAGDGTGGMLPSTAARMAGAAGPGSGGVSTDQGASTGPGAEERMVSAAVGVSDGTPEAGADERPAITGRARRIITV